MNSQLYFIDFKNDFKNIKFIFTVKNKYYPNQHL